MLGSRHFKELTMLDILVGGGGYVGLSVAVSIKTAAPHLGVMVVDAAPEDAWQKDARASAIAAAASRMLAALGLWEKMLPEAQPITRMEITDSRTSDPVRPVFLTFDGEAGPGEPFAHMVPNPR
jgi:2-octaprenyl-6-methoxyphenol hydroxylase